VEATNNIDPVVSAFLQSRPFTRKQRYYGACIVYLMYVEGVFGETIRFLYILRHAADGVDKGVIDADLQSLREIRKYFKSKMGSDILFHGWENGHLRNAIAHLRLKYDENAKKMNF